MTRFTRQNTHGYSEDELDTMNEMFDSECEARGITTETHPDECDKVAEDVLFTVDQDLRYGDQDVR